MRLTILPKLFLSLFITSMLMIVGMSMLVNYSFKTGFQEYVNKDEYKKVTQLAERLTSVYSQEQGWDRLKAEPQIWNELFVSIGEPPPPRKNHARLIDKSFPNKNEHVPKEGKLSPLSHRVSLLDKESVWVTGFYHSVQTALDPDFSVEITVDGQSVGWLVIKENNVISGSLLKSFYEQQQSHFYLIITLAGIFSLFVAALLVRHFLLPLKQLRKGAISLSRGDTFQLVKVRGSDELADLGNAFNSLAISLKQQKAYREQWITDISHELRTPLAVLRSETEAIQDGIRKPELKYIHSMHHQIINLGKLVDDLYLLSRSDSGIYQVNLQSVDLIKIVDDVMAKFEQRFDAKGIEVQKKYSLSDKASLSGDEKTLIQLLNNLLENSFRYTDSPGVIAVSVGCFSDKVTLVIEDTAPSVDVDELPKLFERLYRVDKSRSREFGGSGLGLSICQNIVNMHQGDIIATQSTLGGIAVMVTFYNIN